MAFYGTLWNGGSAFNDGSDLMLSDVDSAAVTPTSAVCYAKYLGRAPRDMTSATLWMYLSVAGSGVTWAEAGIATGDMPTTISGSTTLTFKGSTNISANVTGSAGPFLATVTGFVIPKGTNIWALVSISATGMPQMRVRLPSDFHTGNATKAATQISTQIGVAVASFACSSAGTINNCYNVRVA